MKVVPKGVYSGEVAPENDENSWDVGGGILLRVQSDDLLLLVRWSNGVGCRFVGVYELTRVDCGRLLDESTRV